MASQPVGTEQLKLTALAFTDLPIPIVPAPRRRRWMDEAKDRWPNRCLPLLVANEAGWNLLNAVGFEATWNGGDRPEDLSIETDEDRWPPPVTSHFGHGIVTFLIPYVFRTPAGWNLLARGPANWPKDGIYALEGLVGTDWACANFTMNWKLTRPDHPVRFEAEEPFCMLVPQRRGELEEFGAELLPISADPATEEEYRIFGRNRELMQINKFLSAHVDDLAPYKTAWERHYYKGLTPSGTRFDGHQTHLKLAPFERREPD